MVPHPSIDIDESGLYSQLTYNQKAFPFVADLGDDDWQCTLCRTGIMTSTSTLESHFQSRRHKKYFSDWKSALKLKRKHEWCKGISPIKQRIEKLGLWRWRSNLKDLLLEYLTTPKNDDRLLTKTLSTLKKYEQMERISLLELAVWKSHCLGYTITNDSSKDVIFETMQDIEDYGALDTMFNPSEFRKIRRVTSGVNVIVRLVITFL